MGILFEQLGGIALEEAYASKMVTLSSGELMPNRPSLSKEYVDDVNLVNHWRTIRKKYLKFTSKTQEFLDLQYKSIIGDSNEKIPWYYHKRY